LFTTTPRAACRHQHRVRLFTLSPLAHLCLEYLSGFVSALHINVSVSGLVKVTAAQLSPSLFPFVCSRGQLYPILSLFLTSLACLVTLDRPGQPLLASNPVRCAFLDHLGHDFGFYFITFIILPYSNSHVDYSSTLQEEWGVRDWCPHNASVKSCGKSWTGGVPI